MRRWLVSAIISLLVCPNFAKAESNDVAERLAAEIRVSLPGASVSVPDPNGLDITYEGQTRSVGIGSVRGACSESADSCEKAIHDYAVRAISYMLEAIPLSQAQLRAVVRSKDYLDALHSQMGISDSYVSEALAGGLEVVCYRDLPKGRRPIMSSDLSALNLDQKSALSVCKENSLKALAPVSSKWKELPEQGIGVIQEGDDVTAYLLAPKEWKPLAAKLGVLIVAIPALDTLVYSRGNNAIQLDAFSAIVEKMHSEKPIPTSAVVLRWTDRGWSAIQ